MDNRSQAYQWREVFQFFKHNVWFGNPKPYDSPFIPESSSLPVLPGISLAGSVTVHAAHLKVSFAVLFDQRSREESHESDGQELGQRPPGEDIIQGGDL